MKEVTKTKTTNDDQLAMKKARLIKVCRQGIDSFREHVEKADNLKDVADKVDVFTRDLAAALKKQLKPVKNAPAKKKK